MFTTGRLFGVQHRFWCLPSPLRTDKHVMKSSISLLNNVTGRMHLKSSCQNLIKLIDCHITGYFAVGGLIDV